MRRRNRAGRGAVDDYVMDMPVVLTKSFGLAVAAVLALGALDAASAQRRPDYQGIMVEEGQPARSKKKGIEKPNRVEKPKRVEQARPRPRGSSTYIPPPNPSPDTGPARVAPPSPGVYMPPPVNSFGDRVTNCIHSYPLNAGVGNNPTNQQAYIRQCAN